jgi:hypothetical protein
MAGGNSPPGNGCGVAAGRRVTSPKSRKIFKAFNSQCSDPVKCRYGNKWRERKVEERTGNSRRENGDDGSAAGYALQSYRSPDHAPAPSSASLLALDSRLFDPPKNLFGVHFITPTPRAIG